MVAAEGNGKPIKKKARFGVQSDKHVFIYEPQNDITPQELSQAFPLLMQGIIVGISMKLLAMTGNPAVMIGTPDSVEVFWEDMPKGVRRHFRVIEKEKPTIATPKKGIILPRDK
jgi:hypothetical protein